MERGVEIRKEIPIYTDRVVEVPVSEPFIIENTREIPLIMTDVLPVQVEKAVVTKEHGEMYQEVLIRNPVVQQQEVRF